MSARTSREPMIGGEPRVQLLPPMVRQRERNRRTRRMLVLAVVVAIAVVGGGTAFGYLRAMQAQTALAAEHERTAQILAQQAQFAPATKVDALVSATRDAQSLVTSNEVRWSEIFAEFTSRVPDGFAIAKTAVDGRAPWEAELVPAGVLRAPGVAFVSVTLRGSEYRSAADFAGTVSFLDGVSDFIVRSTEGTEGGYATLITFTLDPSRLQERFLQDAAGDTDADEEADE